MAQNPVLLDCNCLPRREFKEIALELNLIADYMSQDSDRLVFRKFDKLQITNLLYLQHQLAHITEKVATLTTSNKKADEHVLQQLLSRLDPLLEKYHAAVERFKTTANSPPVPRYVIDSLRKLHSELGWTSFENQHSIGEGWTDLAPIVAREKGLIHRYIDDTPKVSHQFAKFSGFNPKSLVYTYSEHAVRIFEQGIIGIFVLALVGAPVIIFARVPSLYGTILVTLGFIIVAIPILASLIKKSDIPHVGLVFGYAAVLVAFTSQRQ